MNVARNVAPATNGARVMGSREAGRGRANRWTSGIAEMEGTGHGSGQGRRPGQRGVARKGGHSHRGWQTHWPRNDRIERTAAGERTRTSDVGLASDSTAQDERVTNQGRV